MKQEWWKKLDEDQLYIMSSYLQEMERVRGQVPVKFKATEACSCCGNVGYVPQHHRFLCVFCWTCAPMLADFTEAAEEMRAKQGKGEYSWDKVRSNIPIGIEDVQHDESPSDILIYTDRNFTQDELKALIS